MKPAGTMNKPIHCFVAGLCGILVFSAVYGQEATGTAGTVRLGLSQTIATPETPFWLHANRDGRIPLHSRRNTVLFGAYDRTFFQQSDFLDFEAGIRVDMLASDLDHQVRFSELYAHVRAAGGQVSIGRFHDIIGLNSGYLTTGSMLMSHNALQPWKIRLSTDGYRSIPFTGERLSFKARWSEAILTDHRFVENVRVHQKNLYFRFQPVARVTFTGGVVHNLMWGGRHPELGRLHGSFSDWLKDVLIRPDTRVFHNVTPFGNGLGAYDMGVEFHYDRNMTVGVYRMFYIEDKQSLDLRSPRDGMWTFFLDRRGDEKQRWIGFVTYEHVNTKKQDAGSHDAYGRAMYYSHNVYRDGWIHHGQVLGTPFFMIDTDKIGSKDRVLVNNIILAHHLGISGSLTRDLSYDLLISYSRNYGICNDQTSGGSCRGTVESPVQQRADYIPFRELRRDRYSMMIRLRLPMDALIRSARAHSALHEAEPDRRFLGYISTALDAGKYHEEALFGFEIGLIMSLN